MHETTRVFDTHGVVVQRMIDAAREDLLWAQYMKCDGMPDPVGPQPCLPGRHNTHVTRCACAR